MSAKGSFIVPASFGAICWPGLTSTASPAFQLTCSPSAAGGRDLKLKVAAASKGTKMPEGLRGDLRPHRSAPVRRVHPEEGFMNTHPNANKAAQMKVSAGLSVRCGTARF